MLDDLRRLFRSSLDAFRAEVDTREPEDQIAEVLSAMRREMVAAKVMISELEGDLGRANAQLEAERAELQRCERRAELAERIGDGETVRIAQEFAARHREKVVVLEQKVRAVEAEIVLRRREGDEMRRRYKEADANRFALLAQLRRSAARRNMGSSLSDREGPLADLDRMRDRVHMDADLMDALDELEGRPLDDPPPSPTELDERLKELKRRMGRE